MASGNCGVVLRIGDAVAVLVDIAALPRGTRDIAAACALRQATGHDDIKIGRRPTGRPRLDPPWSELGVSIAVREPVLLAGFATAGRVGVDLEPADGVRVVADPYRMARDHFAAGEARAVAALGTARARTLFLRLWVAKEAALKLTGRGVYDGLAQPDLTEALTHLAHDDREPIRAELAGTARLAIAVRRVATRAGPMLCALARDDGEA